jgi:hypothetical protein
MGAFLNAVNNIARTGRGLVSLTSRIERDGVKLRVTSTYPLKNASDVADALESADKPVPITYPSDNGLTSLGTGYRGAAASAKVDGFVLAEAVRADVIAEAAAAAPPAPPAPPVTPATVPNGKRQTATK